MRHAYHAAVVLAIAAPALAQTSAPPGLYGISGQSGDNAVLYQIDPFTGAASEFLTLNADGGFIMGLTGLGGQMYASLLSDFPGSPGGNSLGRIDIDTGVVTHVSDVNARLNVTGLAANESAGLLYTIDAGSSALYAITPGGVLTEVGSTGGVDGRGLAYDDAEGILYAVSLNDNLYTIDASTGSSTLVGHVDISATGLDWAGMAFDEYTNTLLLNDGVGGNLWKIDTATAGTTLVGANGLTGISGLAWVPAPGTLALAFPALTLARRRRR